MGFCRIVLAGGSYTGKTTLIRMITQEFSIKKVPDDTTRGMRTDEKEGDPYNFITEATFQERKKNGDYFATVQYNGYNYGVQREPLFQEKAWVMDIVARYLPQFKEIEGVISIYLEPSATDEELRKRAIDRGDPPEVIEQRIRLLLEEEKYKTGFDYYISGDLSIAEKYAFIRKLIVKQDVGI